MPCSDLTPAPAFASKLRPIQLDALREMASMGAGHAATALSKMTGMRVMIEVPTVSVVPGGALCELFADGRPHMLVKLNAGSPLTAKLLLAFSTQAAADLGNLLLGRPVGTAEIDPLGASAIQEVGNVIGAAYLNALADVTGWTIALSPPELVEGGPAAHLDAGETNGTPPLALCLETRFRVGSTIDAIPSHVLLFPLVDAATALLERIGLS
jgi:chemotaxis protein CheC